MCVARDAHLAPLVCLIRIFLRRGSLARVHLQAHLRLRRGRPAPACRYLCSLRRWPGALRFARSKEQGISVPLTFISRAGTLSMCCRGVDAALPGAVYTNSSSAQSGRDAPTWTTCMTTMNTRMSATHHRASSPRTTMYRPRGLSGLCCSRRGRASDRRAPWHCCKPSHACSVRSSRRSSFGTRVRRPGVFLFFTLLPLTLTVVCHLQAKLDAACRHLHWRF